MTANTDALAGLRAATEHLSRDTEETQAKAIIKAALPFLLDLLPTDLEDGLSYLQARCTLSKAWFKALRGDIKELRKAPKQGPKAQMGSLEEVRRLHPAIDFKDNHMALGFRVDLKDEGEGVLLLISNGKEVRAEVFTPQDRGEGVELGGQNYILNGKGTPPILQDVWNLAGVKAFLENSTQPETLYEDIKAALKKYLDLPEAVYGLLAAWIVGTYFAQLFSAFPFLHFIGPKETGKSKTLEALRFASFSAWKGRDITAAALGDTVDGMRGTVLIDQAERLGEKEEGSTNLVGLLADSYKKAGGNRRVIEMTKAGRRALEFSTYGPKAFASTKQIDPDLKDRCVRIPMTRTKLPLPDLEGWEPEWGQLRDSCYRFSLLAFQEVERAYMAIPGDGTRATELWRPLGAVLKGLGVAEDEAGAVQKFFAGQCQESRHEPSTWELILLGILKEQAEAETEPFHTKLQSNDYL